MHYWCEFVDHQVATINAGSVDELHRIARSHGRAVKRYWPLPYPASPVLNPGSCPAFCWQPQTCKGRSSCPRNIACSE